MKKITLFSLFLFILTSCSTDDSNNDDNPQTQASIIGKWELEELLNGTENQNIDECEQLNTLEFFENGTTFEQDYYKGTGGECFDAGHGSAEFSVTGNILTLTFTSEDGILVYEQEIAELTEQKLILLVDEQYNGPVDGEIFTVTYKRID